MVDAMTGVDPRARELVAVLLELEQLRERELVLQGRMRELVLVFRQLAAAEQAAEDRRLAEMRVAEQDSDALAGRGRVPRWVRRAQQNTREPGHGGSTHKLNGRLTALSQPVVCPAGCPLLADGVTHQHTADGQIL